MEARHLTGTASLRWNKAVTKEVPVCTKKRTYLMSVWRCGSLKEGKALTVEVLWIPGPAAEQSYSTKEGLDVFPFFFKCCVSDTFLL